MLLGRIIRHPFGPEQRLYQRIFLLIVYDSHSFIYLTFIDVFKHPLELWNCGFVHSSKQFEEFRDDVNYSELFEDFKLLEGLKQVCYSFIYLRGLFLIVFFLSFFLFLLQVVDQHGISLASEWLEFISHHY